MIVELGGGLLLLTGLLTRWAALALAVFGLGLGLSLPLSVDTVLTSLPPGQTGVGNAMSRTLQSIASALGTAILGGFVLPGQG